MEKRIINRNFFERKAEEVAKDLVGKSIYYKNNEYKIIKTEAYYHYEKDSNEKYFCYGVKNDTGENIKTSSTFPLFREPGTWCIYGGQLLLSVTSSEIPDNVLIKEVLAPDGELYTTDKIAKTLHLYKSDLDSQYWDFQGLSSYNNADLYLIDNNFIPEIKPYRRKNIKEDSPYQFYMEVENNK